MLASGAVNNANNIRSGFRACGIYPLNIDKVLARLPPLLTPSEVRDDLHQQLTDELRRNRYGEQKKATRAKKINRLPPGTSYTVSAVPPLEQEEAGEYWYLVRYPTLPFPKHLPAIPVLYLYWVMVQNVYQYRYLFKYSSY
jgi:hypothetical protein